MNFERGQDPKKTLKIGLNPLLVQGISVLKGIDYSMAGESWNWKFINPKRKRRIHRILRSLADGSCRETYSVWTPDGRFYNDLRNFSLDENITDQSCFIFDDQIYKM